MTDRAVTDRIVLSHTGSQRTLEAIPELAAKHRADVVTLTLQFGSEKDLEEVRDRALAAGAVRAHVLDVAGEFVSDYLVHALKADALDVEGGTVDALMSVVTARKLVDIAHIEGAMSVAHGVAGGRNRLEVALRALDPTLTVIAVPGDPGPVASPAAPLRIESPAEPALVDISFTCGEPTAINGVTMPLVELLDSLGMIAGAHGIGRAAGRAPALLVLSAAHLKLKALSGTDDGTDDLGGMMEEVTRHYADIIAKGLWFSRFREALDAFVDKTQERLNGVVRLKLFKADCQAIDVAQAPTTGRMLPLVGTRD